MDSTKLPTLEARLYSKMPLFGARQRRKAAEALARDGSSEAVRSLSQAVTRSDDPNVRTIALNALRHINNQVCINAVCAVWTATRNEDLANLLIEHGWVATGPVDVKVLSALLAERVAGVTKGGAEVVEPLLQALEDADRKIGYRAHLCLLALTDPDALDNICERWSRTRDWWLEQVVLRRSYVARQPFEARVLSALKVGRLEDITQDGSQVVALLLQACSDKDRTIAKHAELTLKKLKHPEAQEALCRLAIEQGCQLTCQVAVASQYVPLDPKKRVLFFFLTEQWDKYESLDFNCAQLQKAYELGDTQLRQRIAHKVGQSGRAEWLRIFILERQEQQLGEMTDDEWKTTLEVLSSSKQWEQMWQLAQSAPPIWSVRILQQLGQRFITQVPGELSELFRCWAKLNMGELLSNSSNAQLFANRSSDKKIQLSSLPDGKLLQTLIEQTNKYLLASEKLCKSDLHYLSRLPIKQMSLEDMKLVQGVLINRDLSKAEREWLEFILALMRWQRRFDIEVEEAPQTIDAREFDIEVEG